MDARFKRTSARSSPGFTTARRSLYSRRHALLRVHNGVVIVATDVRYYQTTGGVRPVEAYLDALAVAERARIAAMLEDIALSDSIGAAVVARHIEGKLWEIKLSRHRIFYVVLTGPVMVLLHAYKKQGQRAPKRELAVARARMKEILDG
jgi:phage-related protein